MAFCEPDPTEGIAGIKMPKTKRHHTWTGEEIAQYRAYWRLRLVLGDLCVCYPT